MHAIKTTGIATATAIGFYAIARCFCILIIALSESIKSIPNALFVENIYLIAIAAVFVACVFNASKVFAAINYDQAASKGNRLEQMQLMLAPIVGLIGGIIHQLMVA